MLEGSERRELIREYYRLRRRAHVLTGSAGATAASATAASSGGDDPGPVREAFLRWYEARHDDVPQDVAEVVSTILDEWGPRAHPGERSLYACSPHRIEMAARLIRNAYLSRPRERGAAPASGVDAVVHRAERARRRIRGPVPRRRAHRGRGPR